MPTNQISFLSGYKPYPSSLTDKNYPEQTRDLLKSRAKAFSKWHDFLHLQHFRKGLMAKQPPFLHPTLGLVYYEGTIGNLCQVRYSWDANPPYTRTATHPNSHGYAEFLSGRRDPFTSSGYSWYHAFDLPNAGDWQLDYVGVYPGKNHAIETMTGNLTPRPFCYTQSGIPIIQHKDDLDTYCPQFKNKYAIATEITFSPELITKYAGHPLGWKPAYLLEATEAVVEWSGYKITLICDIYEYGIKVGKETSILYDTPARSEEVIHSEIKAGDKFPGVLDPKINISYIQDTYLDTENNGYFIPPYSITNNKLYSATAANSFIVNIGPGIFKRYNPGDPYEYYVEAPIPNIITNTFYTFFEYKVDLFSDIFSDIVRPVSSTQRAELQKNFLRYYDAVRINNWSFKLTPKKQSYGYITLKMAEGFKNNPKSLRLDWTGFNDRPNNKTAKLYFADGRSASVVFAIKISRYAQYSWDDYDYITQYNRKTIIIERDKAANSLQETFFENNKMPTRGLFRYVPQWGEHHGVDVQGHVIEKDKPWYASGIFQIVAIVVVVVITIYTAGAASAAYAAAANTAAGVGASATVGAVVGAMAAIGVVAGMVAISLTILGLAFQNASLISIGSTLGLVAGILSLPNILLGAYQTGIAAFGQSSTAPAANTILSTSNNAAINGVGSLSNMSASQFASFAAGNGFNFGLLSLNSGGLQFASQYTVQGLSATVANAIAPVAVDFATIAGSSTFNFASVLNMGTQSNAGSFTAALKAIFKAAKEAYSIYDNLNVRGGYFKNQGNYSDQDMPANEQQEEHRPRWQLRHDGTMRAHSQLLEPDLGLEKGTLLYIDPRLKNKLKVDFSTDLPPLPSVELPPLTLMRPVKISAKTPQLPKIPKRPKKW